MSGDSSKFRELLNGLQQSIDDAEHKPGQWMVALSQMGGISTVPSGNGEALANMLSAGQEKCWAGFSFKRDAWLAVASVNALPELISIARGVEALIEASPDAYPGLRELLNGGKSVDVA